MATAQRPGSVDQELVLDLGCVGAQLLPIVGGKAANLGELIRAGFPVPPGFCITTAAYQQVAADAVDPGVQDTGRLAERARVAILAALVPADVADAVKSAYRALGDDVPVAVRSSATAEDLPWASFAGQQDTYLNIVGADAVLDAVRRCWASLWTDRAVSYRTTNGIDHATVRLAVVVQQMIDPQVAGVLFTADPVTGHRGHTVIDASPGLGEAVVSGTVNPDHFVVDAAGAVLERRLGDKRVAVRSLPGGGTEQVARPADAEQPCLRDAQIRDLTALGQRVQEHYGAPQDIEWAVDGAGKLWLTQARPITTLYPLPIPPDGQLRVYLCASLAQGLTRPVTPMGIAAFRLIASCMSELVFGTAVSDPIAGPAVFVEAGQRAFVDVTPVLRSRIGRALAPRILDVMEARSAVVLRRLCDDPRLAEQATSRWPFVRRLLAVAVRFRIPLLIGQALVSPAAARRRVDRVGGLLRSQLAVPAGVTGAQRLDHVERLLNTAVIPIMPTVTPVAGAGFLALALASKLARDDVEPGEWDEVLRGLPHNVTTEMDLTLWALATRVRADSAAAAALREAVPVELAHRFTSRDLPTLLQRGLEEFLAQHGHRAVAEIDLGMPRWSDDPTHVLGVLANYLRLEDPDLAPDAQFVRGARAAEAAATRVVSRVRRRSRLRAAVVRVALGRVRELVGMRETHKDYLVRVLAHGREQLAAVGAELAGRGLLAEPEDVFFLDLVQVRAALAGVDFRAVVAARQEDYERELRRRQVPRMMLSDGSVPEALATSAQVPVEGQLAGTPASAGTVTAVARVVLDPVGAQLEPGEILVAPSTDPGWTPLFLTAGGLVMEMGGANSHGAVVAREYGIPAVVGVPDATLRISTGQRITVNGATGLV
ncbi:MAG TPA: PEP/pyruvate-binding domain-containing protein, partial [Pseudonocardiaceae bacterium]|nr:PEP/pyruvate-binding domain-containing protein [Pseudonocardiaceae bacterium]